MRLDIVESCLLFLFIVSFPLFSGQVMLACSLCIVIDCECVENNAGLSPDVKDVSPDVKVFSWAVFA